MNGWYLNKKLTNYGYSDVMFADIFLKKNGSEPRGQLVMKVSKEGQVSSEMLKFGKT